jgi:AraC-like DNA-binding protein
VNGATINLAYFEMPRGKTFERHVHRMHQLAWASSGALTVVIDQRRWVLPPSMALWIPGGTWHTTVAMRATVMHGIYLSPEDVKVGWSAPTVLSVSPLADQLIRRLATDLSDDARVRAEGVLLDVLRPAPMPDIALPMPNDDRALRTAEIFLSDPADRRSLDRLAHDAGTSPRTLLRVFLAETGMTFSQWRAQARVQLATAHLAEGTPVSRVAQLVGYTTPSAFAAAFRRVTGSAPAGYLGPASSSGEAGPAALPAD